MVTEIPLACNNLPREAEMIPFPNEDVTPPVTKIYLVEAISLDSNLWDTKLYYLVQRSASKEDNSINELLS